MQLRTLIILATVAASGFVSTAPVVSAEARSLRAAAGGYVYIGDRADKDAQTQWCNWNCPGFCPSDMCAPDDGSVPTTAPSTEPTTAPPSTEPTTAPPSTEPTTPPSTEPTTPPSTEPTAAPEPSSDGEGKDDSDCEIPAPTDGGDDDDSDCEIPAPTDGGANDDSDCEIIVRI